MKKVLKIISIALCSLLAISFTACQKTPDDEVKSQLVAVVEEADFNFGSVTLSSKTTSAESAFTLKYQKDDQFNWDLYYMKSQNDGSENVMKAQALFMRDDGLYSILSGGSFNPIIIPTSNYVSAIDSYLVNNPAQILKVMSKEGLYEKIISAINLIIKLPQGVEDNLEKLPELVLSLMKNPTLLLNGESTNVYNGYRLMVDLVECTKNYLDEFVKIGAKIDAEPTITVDELYNSQDFVQAFDGILKTSSAETAKQFVIAVNYLIEKNGSNVLFEVLEPIKGENAYDYFNRFINTKVSGLTIASLRIMDLAGILKIDSTIEEEFAIIRSNILDAIKSFTNTFKVVYFFDTDCNLTRISIDFNLKVSSFPSGAGILGYQSSHVKIDFRPLKPNDTLHKIETNS